MIKKIIPVEKFGIKAVAIYYLDKNTRRFMRSHGVYLAEIMEKEKYYYPITEYGFIKNTSCEVYRDLPEMKKNGWKINF